MSPAEVLQAAVAALKAAPSVRFSGDIVSAGGPGEIDLRIQGSTISCTLTVGDVRTEIVQIGDEVYLRGDEPALAAAGLPAEAVGRWLVLGAEHAALMDGYSLDDLAGGLTDVDSPLNPQVEQATLDGRRVVVVSQRNGSRLYIANTGPAYPLRGILAGAGAGQIDFTEYGGDFQISAPAGAVSLGDAGL